MKVEGKHFLSTAGSSGIGLALAHAPLAKGAKIVAQGGGLMLWQVRYRSFKVF
ncbi:hypothetical protein AWB64_00145 [Caballeronia sordidicola]|uniref:Uncharacterized protein n=1 Tax=Caballeronia sordidicola TaxID=196367 RepID=A0A158EPL9_CABSO|nr:hypothetical protein [Caballeronia sordidicola]SAL09436.1 hypothetical protein AWB64_00145 [Caballeronia sordidicola]